VPEPFNPQIGRQNADKQRTNHRNHEDPEYKCDDNISEPAFVPRVMDLQRSQEFINALKDVTLDEGNLDEDVLQRLWEPLTEPVDVSDPDFCLSLDLFLSTTNTSEETYNSSWATVLYHHPEDKILTYARIKSKITELSGIIPIVHHMCINTCIAFMGPFSALMECFKCHEARYIDDTEKPRWEYYTMLIGLQLQALWHTKESAQKMQHHSQHTATIIAEMEETGGQIPIYDNVYLGSDYIATVNLVEWAIAAHGMYESPQVLLVLI
jgi:hypothetical protein